MKKNLEISSLKVNENIISFKIAPIINFTMINLYIYNNTKKLSVNEFSLDFINDSYIISINKEIILDTMLYFFINTPDYFSGIIYIYYDLKLLEFNTSKSVLPLIVPSNIESYNYNFSFMTFDNRPIFSSIQKIGICNGISTSSKVFFVSLEFENKKFEINLLDSSGKSVPDGDYVIEIFTGG